MGETHQTNVLFFLCCSQLVSVCVLAGGKCRSVTPVQLLRSLFIFITFIFVAQKDESVMVKWKLSRTETAASYR